MITIDIFGGLGNQLFQIFTLLSYSIVHNNKFYFKENIIYGNRKIIYWDNIFCYLQKYILIYEDHVCINENSYTYTYLPKFSDNINIKFSGYFQSYKYFYNNYDEIYKIINLDKIKQDIINKYKINYENLVSLHFRIGDYITLQDHHPILDINYYINSINKLIEDTGIDNWSIKYFFEEKDYNDVFDKIIILKKIFIYIDFISVDTKMSDWEQLIIMSLCKHNIIANSTYSWWGAYLNNNKDKRIYYPSIWFGPSQNKDTRDLFPEIWNKVNV